MNLTQATDQAASVGDDIQNLRRKFAPVATFVSELDGVLSSAESKSATAAVDKVADTIRVLQRTSDELTMILSGMRRRG